jgi:O-antigen/teichoic acid export membrane protein
MSSSPYKSLGKNTIIFALGTFGSKAISFFMLPVFTRVLTQADYGKIDIITTSISLLLPLVTLNIVEAVFRFTLDKGTVEQKQEVFSSALVVGTAGFLCLLLFIPVFVHFSVSGSLLLAFLALFFIDIVHGITKVLIRAEQRLRLFAISDIIHTAVFASMGILLVAFLRLGVIGYLLSQIIAVTVSTGVLFIFGKVRGYVKPALVSKSAISKLAKYSLPLVPNTLGWWIINASDRYLLTLFIGFEAAGVYAVAHRFPLLITIFSAIFYQAWQISSIEQFSESTVERDKFYSNVFRFLYSFMFLLLILLSIFVVPLINLLVGESFSDAVNYVPILLVGVVFQSFSSFFGVGYLASKKTKGALTTTLWASAINLILNIILIPLIGIQAASISTAVAFVTMWILRVFQTRRYFVIGIDWKNFITVSSISCLSVILLLYIERPIFIQLGLLFVLVLVQRAEIKSFGRSMMRALKEYTIRHH